MLQTKPYLVIISRKLSASVRREALPVIKVPKYLSADLNKARFKEKNRSDKLKRKHKELKKSWNSGDVRPKLNKNICIISADNKKYNHYFGQTYKTVDNIPLISKEWINGRKTIGSRMRFHIYSDNPSKLVTGEDSSDTFESLGLTANVCEAIHSMAIWEPTVIQKAVIPSILDHKNVICSAETGSGKTIAYMAPLIQMIREYKELKGEDQPRGLPLGLVVVPSRELAEQVGRVAQHLAAFAGVGVSTMIGGLPKHLTHNGMDLIVSTIGLVEPLMRKRVYSLRQLNHLVIDESDTLFDDTFNSETLDLLGSVSIRHSNDLSEQDYDDEDGSRGSDSEAESKLGGVQLVCVSATMPKNLKNTLGSVVDIENNFECVNSGRLHHIMPHVKQDFYRIDRHNRNTQLLELVLKDVQSGRPVIIFSNRSDSSNWIYHFLNDNGIKCSRLNKKITDEERRDQLTRFQSGESDVISCTDLGSRGLDTVRVRHVINFDCPHNVNDYIHRAGRTGRVGSSGQCLVSTFVAFKPDVFMLQQLESALRLNKPIEAIDSNFKRRAKNKKRI